MEMKAHAAIDIGAESGRVVVGALREETLDLGEVHRFPNKALRLADGLHWDLDGLWSGVLEGIQRAAAWSRERGVPLASVGVDTWGVDYALLDQSGKVLGSPFCYRDDRTGTVFEEVIGKLGREALYDATGIQFMALNTLFQLAAHNANDPDTVSKAAKLLFMPDLLHYMLTGQAVVEATIASTSQMLDARTGRWATGMLRELGIPAQMLGDIVPSGTVVGELLPELASQVRADEGVRVITPASHDTASAVAAVPADTSSNWCYLSSGTWSLLGAELTEPCLTRAALEVPFTNEGGVGGTVRFLKNITGLWLVQECRRSFQERGIEHDYDELTELAAAADPFRTIIDTDCGPLKSPGRMPEKIAECAGTTGQPEPEDAGQFVRCCLESLALTYRHTLTRLEQVLDRRFDVLHIVGGGGRNRLLNQMAADATGRRVVVGPYEAAAVGNILVQAMGAGEIDDPSRIRRIVAATFKPETYLPEDPSVWDRAYERFTGLLGPC